MPGSEKISFKKWSETAWLKDPHEEFRPICQVIEFREDPLTGKKCRINISRSMRPKATATCGRSFENLIKESRAGCPFCPENIEKNTPAFVDGFPKRIKFNRCWLFPNHYPFGRFHAVGVLSDEHYLEINEFNSKMIEDCLKACLKYFKIIHSKYRDFKYWYFNWNHLPPGAASIIHPHVQIFADTGPTPYLQELIKSSERFYKRTGVNFWAELARAEEKTGERFIAKCGSINWLASFAPQGNNEVMAIFEDVPSIAKTDDKRLSEFCHGLSLILNGYHKIGISSFNLALFSGPCDENLSEFYLLNAKIVSRPDPAPFYTSDIGFMEKFHGEPVIEKMPEDLA
ncbi:MAG: hypothetical protein ACUVQM_02150, partial [Candidatus Hadarchaeaceae archaeon]